MFLQSLRITSRSVALALVTAFAACLSLSATAATTTSRGDISVITVHGSVTATMAGMTVPLSAGAILQLPATVRTGADGAVELRQGTSTFAAAGNTELEIPESAAEDGLIERIVQIRGNAFYNIGKRTGTRLRVEAPYLVAVIKGTQFNVAAQEDSTTIALFEGHLEVRATDDSDVVDLDAGEIAIRRRNDVSISVLRLNAARDNARRNPELAARQQNDSSTPNSDAVTARNSGDTVRPRVDTGPTDSLTPSDGGATPTGRERIVDLLADSNVDVTAKAAAIDLGTQVDVGSAAVSVGTAVEANIAGASVDIGTTTTVDLGAGSVAAAADVGVDVGSVSADIGASAAVDVPTGSVDMDIGATVAAGNVATVDTGIAAAADIPAGTVDVGVDATVAAGVVPAVDVGAGAAVDVAAGAIDAGLDTSVASTDVGAAVGVDAGAGNVSADVGVGPVDVGLDVGSGGIDLDLGLGASDDSGGGGLLGGLLGRKRKD